MRIKRIIIYTVSLLTAPIPLMAFERVERNFTWALVACGLLLTAGSVYAVSGEMKLRHRSLVGNKLLSAAVITLAVGICLAAGALVYLVKN